MSFDEWVELLKQLPPKDRAGLLKVAQRKLSQQSQDKTSRLFWLIFAVAAAVRLICLGSVQFWYDEAFTMDMARLPFARMLAAVAGDVHPPLFYVIQWAWLRLTGPAEFWFRFPSLAFSLLGLWLTWRIAARLNWPRSASLIAVGIMAVNPFQIFFGQEARMYALFQVEILAVLLGVLDRRWWLISLGSLAALYTHNYALIYLPLLAALALIRSEVEMTGDHIVRFPDLETIIVAFGGPLLAWLPWAWVLYHQMTSIAGGYWIQTPSVGEVVEVVYILMAGLSMTKEVFMSACLVVFGGIALVGYQVIRDRPAGSGLLLYLALTPLALVLAVSVLWKPILLYRGLIPSTVAAYLLIGWSLSRLTTIRSRLYAAIFIAPVLLTGIGAGWVYNPKGGGEIKQWIRQVANEWQPGDVIVHGASSTMVGWLAYAPDIPQYKLTRCGDWEARGGLSWQTQEALGIREIQPDELRRYNRVWLVWSEGPLHNPCLRDQIAPLISQAEPVKIFQDDETSLSGVWTYAP